MQYLHLMRPHHWIKNAFVLVPLPFAVAKGARLDLLPFLLGFAGFCLINSAIYAFNDVMDRDADRLNSRKRTRPVASGAVSPAAASVLALILLALGLGGTLWGGGSSAVTIAAIYIVVNLGYSWRLKHVPLLDVFLLASGFLLRVLLGTALLDVPPSSWLLVCASALALFLAFTKRRADLVAGVDPDERPALAGYSASFLDQAMAIMCGITLLAYTLYSIDAEVFVTGRELTAMPFVAFALLHYLRVAYTRGEGASPVDLVLRSPTLQVCTLGWVVATLWSLGVF